MRHKYASHLCCHTIHKNTNKNVCDEISHTKGAGVSCPQNYGSTIQMKRRNTMSPFASQTSTLSLCRRQDVSYHASGVCGDFHVLKLLFFKHDALLSPQRRATWKSVSNPWARPRRRVSETNHFTHGQNSFFFLLFFCVLITKANPRAIFFCIHITKMVTCM